MDRKARMDNKDKMDSLVSKVRELVRASKVRVKDSQMVNTTMVTDNSAIAPTMDMVISLVRDKDSSRDKDLVMVVLKDRDKTQETGLVMNVAAALIFSD